MAKLPETDLERGIFVVDLSGLALPPKALKEIENNIGKAVEKTIATLDLFDKKNLLFSDTLTTKGKVVRLKKEVQSKTIRR